VLDHSIDEIRNDILRMGSFIGEQIANAVRALKNRDLSLAHRVVESDQRVNELRYRVESECVRTIATQQPAAKDLRYIIAAIHMAGELERIADHASGIASIAIRIGDEPLIKPLIDIPRMQEIACEMVQDALDAFVQMDAEAAKAVAARDEEVDELYVQVLRELLTFMMQDPKTITQSTYLLWVAHNLERIADRATNLCERVIFAVTAELGDYKPS
jgi:phosphate transport system protein